MRPGDKLPSEAELSEALSVSSITVKKALGDLANSGVIYRLKGKGSFINEPQAPKRSRIIAMVFALQSIEDKSFAGWILGAQSYLSAHNYSLVVERVDMDAALAQEQITRLMNLGVDGFLFYLHTPDDMLPLIDWVERQKPLVLIDRRSMLRTCTYVGANNLDGGMQAVQHLLSLGHRRIGFVDFDAFLNSEQERFQGYRQALVSYGIDPDTQQHSNLLLQTEEEIVESTRAYGSTALFAVNDVCALRTMEILSQGGFRVPEDLSIVGFDDSPLSRESTLRLTSVEQSFETLGEKSAWLLHSVIRNECPKGTQLQVGLRLLVGNSTAPPQI